MSLRETCNFWATPASSQVSKAANKGYKVSALLVESGK